ncbi:HNH endonuclease [Martelella alba]|uniref:HNH endonuclease n=1 Tax=Martelella alba TaxID=2590451 RepID=A0A506U0D8_9HYPH|nr:HNH endonuclease [Martelella alba]TPW27792.1 HNH endonuclease [Martelella alba]
MEQCIFCKARLDEKTSPEHILLQSLGGRKTTTEVICSSCNNSFGSSIDSALAKSVEPFRNIANFKSGNRRPAPSISGIEAEGKRYNLRPGAIPIPIESQKITITEKYGQKQISISANSEAEFERLLHSAMLKLKVPKEKADSFKEDFLKRVTINSTPAPLFAFKLSFGDDISQRSMAKSCLVLWADAVGNAEISNQRYTDVREFIQNGTVPDTGGNFIRIDTRPLPLLDPKFGTNPNIIWVGSDNQGRVVGYFRLYGAIGWQIEIASEGAAANVLASLVSNPEDPAIWSDDARDLEKLTFAWATQSPGAPDFEAVTQCWGKLIETARERSQKEMISRIVDNAFKRSGAKEGEYPTDQQRDFVFLEIAWELTHALMKIPYSKPLKPPSNSK